jgi:hypothetical protein
MIKIKDGKHLKWRKYMSYRDKLKSSPMRWHDILALRCQNLTYEINMYVL